MSAKRMKRALVYMVLALVCVSVLFGTTMYYLAAPEETARYNRNSADYKYVTDRVQAGWRKNAVELAKFNNGDWQFICFIGAHNDPVKILREEAQRRGVAVTKVDPVRRQPPAVDPLDESEGAISFVDKEGRGRNVLIDGADRLAGSRGHRCFGRETQEVTLPLSEG
jgi:hypothetical protein